MTYRAFDFVAAFDEVLHLRSVRDRSIVGKDWAKLSREYYDRKCQWFVGAD